MIIKCVKVGPLETNCYILIKDGKSLVIDPGDDLNKIEKLIQDEVQGVIITHYHFDHIGVLNDILSKYKTKVYDYRNLSEGYNKIGPFEFKVLFTPGHKEDAISILFEGDKKLFSGDFIFNGSIGRCDLEGGNYQDMQRSIKKVLNYEDNIIIYPGHGEKTTLGAERKNLMSYL